MQVQLSVGVKQQE